MRKHTVIVLVQTLLFASGCHKPTEEKAAAEPAVQGDVITLADPKEFASSVTVEAASKAPEQTQQFNGRLLWDDNATVRIFSPFAGRVEKLLGEVGQQVPQNAPLALIASPDFGQAETDVRRAEIDWEHGRRIAERYHDLFEHGAAARKDVEGAEADLARAEAEKTRALARMKFYTGSSNCFAPFFPLTSPIGGVVVEKNINPGQEVRPDQMLANAPQFVLPLFVVTDPNRLWVQVDVGEAQAGQVKPGSPMIIRSQAFPNQSFAGKVDAVAEALDPITHTLRLRGSLENPNRMLKAFMFVTVELAQAESTEVRVPVKAVFLKKDQHFVFVEVQPGKYQRKPVKISGEYGNRIGVAEGLAPGDRVVCEGSLLLEQVYHSGDGRHISFCAALMIKKLIHFSLHQPLFVALITLLFIAGGVAAFMNLPIEAFPDVSDTQVNVIALFPGHAPEEVEKQVTIPLEVSLSGLPHSVRLFSHTQFGLSFIMITFDDKVDDYFARQRVLERLAGVDLPPGVQPQLGPLSTAIGEVYRFRLRGDHLSSLDLRTIEDWTVERQLRMIPGVADIVTIGGLVKQYEVNPNLTALKYYNITMQQLVTALGRGNSNAGGNYVERGTQQFLIRGIGLLRSADDIGNIVVASHDGVPILVKNLAEVTIGSVPRQGIVGQDENDDIVAGIVLMRKGENPSDVLQAVKAKVSQLNRSILPKGVQVVSYYDRTWLIGTTLHTVFKNLAEGATLVTLVLLLFLGNFRAAAIVAAMIPLSLLATFLGLTWRGIPANLLSLGAMDFGIIVDGAVIVVENIFRKLSEREHSADRTVIRDLIISATSEVGRPTFFSMMIIIAAHIPIFTLQRHEGRIFSPMAWTVTSALIGSLLFSLTIVPLLCYLLLRKNLPHKENFLAAACRRAYEPSFAWVLKHRALVVMVAVCSLALSLVGARKLGAEFLPELNEGTVWVNANLPPGISVSEAATQCAAMRKALHTVPEVDTVISKAGRPEDGTDPKPMNMVECFVGFKPNKEWRPGKTKEDLLQEMDKALDAIPGVETTFSQPIRDNVLESISQIDGQVVIKVFGEDAGVLRTNVEAVLRSIADVPGVSRAFIDRAGEVPQSLINIDRQRAARYGLNVSDIQDMIETGLAGKAATELWEGEKHFSVVVRLRQPERALGRLKDILVDTPDGMHIPLGDVADFDLKSGAMNISRENGTRVVAIGVFIKGRDMGSVVNDMKARVAKIQMPNAYVVTWSGEFENQERAMKRLSLVVPVSVLLIFVLLFDAFKSVRSALLILINVPFALIGGILALLIAGIPLSVSAAIGFIALFGQAVLNGVVMVSVFNQLREEGLTPIQAVMRGATLRLRTVLMTALLAMLGLLPMALSHGIGSETQKPLAIVIIGGLVSATLLTLYVLPVIYLFIAERSEEPLTPAALPAPA